MEKPIRILSLLILVGVISGALSNILDPFLDYLHIVFILGLVHITAAVSYIHLMLPTI